jgi:hypothetical protein
MINRPDSVILGRYADAGGLNVMVSGDQSKSFSRLNQTLPSLVNPNMNTLHCVLIVFGTGTH